MDENRFIRLTKSLADRASRRAAIRGLLAATALTGASLPEADARNPKKKPKKCKAPKKRCGQRCVAVTTDEKHCGACNRKCAAGQTCLGGRCAACDAIVQPGGDVQAAIDAASTSVKQTVCLAPGTHALPAPLFITKSVFVTGAGAERTTLRAAVSQRVIECTGDSVNVRRLTIRGGNAPTIGGGVLHQSGALGLDECVVTGNSAADGGGGIFNGGYLSLTGCEVTDNHVPRDLSRGGGILHFGSDLILDNTRISGNSAESTGGGIDAAGRIITYANGSRVTGNTPDNCDAGTSCG